MEMVMDSSHGRSKESVKENNKKQMQASQRPLPGFEHIQTSTKSS